MNEPVNIIGEYFATKIPDKVPVRLNKNRVEYGVPKGGIFYKQLPPGSWSIVSTSDEMPVIEILHIVEKEHDNSDHLRGWWYKNYMWQNGWIKDPVESFRSLLKSRGLTGRQLIIKKEL